MIDAHILEIKYIIRSLKYNHFHNAENGEFGSGEESSSFSDLYPSDKASALSDGYEEQMQELDFHERHAIKSYTDFYYKKMNAALREGNDDDPALQKTIKRATEALNAGSAPFAFTVKRGIKVTNSDDLFKQFKENVGKAFTDPAFVSTTVHTDNNFGTDITFHIHIPKGAKGLYVASISENPQEREFLLPPKMTFKVTKVYKDISGARFVELAMKK